MGYRNKIYVCSDDDTDMQYYKILKMWKENDNIDFNFYNAHDYNNIMVYSEENIKRNLRERMKNSKLLVVLVGKNTKKLYKYVRWEIELALKMDIPIIVANLNKKNRMDTNLCPAILKDKPVIHIPFAKKSIEYAIKYWQNYYTKAKEEGRSRLYWDFFDNMEYNQ